MKLALNGATTMRADLETDIRAASEAGFDFVEIWSAKLTAYLTERTTGDLAEMLSRSKVSPLSINSIEHITFRDPDRHRQALSECERLCRIASKIGCPYIVVVPSPIPEELIAVDEVLRRKQIIDESVLVLSEMADIAEPVGVGLAFEFLGQTDCSVPTLELASEIVARVDRPSVGLVIDSFHFHAGGSTIEMIEACDPSKVFIFHINDAEDRPRELLEDKHRLLPGLGILPLGEIIAAFQRIGYDRVASVEIFRPEYWDRDPFELACEAKLATESVLAASAR